MLIIQMDVLVSYCLIFIEKLAINADLQADYF